MVSNVPGHERVQCLVVTDGDANKLVCDMVDILRVMGDAAYEKIKDCYDDVLEQLAETQTDIDEREHPAQSPADDDAAPSPEDEDANDKESRPPTNPYKTLMGQLYGWLHKLPVIGFNSGKYGINSSSYPTSCPRQRQRNKK